MGKIFPEGFSRSSLLENSMIDLYFLDLDKKINKINDVYPKDETRSFIYKAKNELKLLILKLNKQYIENNF